MENVPNSASGLDLINLDSLSKSLNTLQIQKPATAICNDKSFKKAVEPSSARFVQDKLYKAFKRCLAIHDKLALRLQTNKIALPQILNDHICQLNSLLPSLASSRKKILFHYDSLDQLIDTLNSLAEIESKMFECAKQKLPKSKPGQASICNPFDQFTDNLAAIMAKINSLRTRCGLHTVSRFIWVADDLSLEGIAEYILRNRPQNIIVLSGAGLSVSSGIPDFRSPGTGLYYNVQKYELPDPTCIFTLDYFKSRPEPFLDVAKELYPGQFTPSIGHYFIRLLEEKGMLLRNYTQNIDCLERLAGISDSKIVEAHGTFASAHCLNPSCKKEFSGSDMKRSVFDKTLLKCDVCQQLVKPDVIMFGEDLPAKFFESRKRDFPLCDLLIVLGTSLKVEPFKFLINEVPLTTPRLLVNREMVALLPQEKRRLGLNEGFLFDQPENYRDVMGKGDCDEMIEKLVDLLGWKQELVALQTKEKSNLKQYAHSLGF